MAAKESEFGRGLTYCIGLFLAHAALANKYKKTFMDVGVSGWPELWFNGASDHLIELDASRIRLASLRKELVDWKNQVIHWGHGFPNQSATEENIKWSIAQAKRFLLQIDKKILKTEATKGQYE